MMAEVIELWKVAVLRPGNFWAQTIALHTHHVKWVGCVLHDLIQPSFSFLVGVALMFSIANRQATGRLTPKLACKAARRALVLILLGVFLRSYYEPATNWTFEDTLSQIGLGYFILYLLAFRSLRFQMITLGVLLFGYWLAFALYHPPAGFNYEAVGCDAKWQQEHNFEGFAAHWNKNANAAWAFDTWFLNLFPRRTPFLFNDGGYSTLSFIPTLGTMILGLVAGRILQTQPRAWLKIRTLSIWGAACLLAGWGLGAAGICPVVKPIWTPSWTLFSGGSCFLMMAAFYLVIDLAQLRKWAFPLIVIGMNSIAAYVMSWIIIKDLCLNSLHIHFGRPFKAYGAEWEQMGEGFLVLLCYFLILLWMYRRKLFLKI